ncbi:ABC transporter ATP-binding protein [Neorhizobium sp. P12A]|uniref:ABC transporter ATP-binding protein n=1 Tax=Neorhizobium sp. P12A TaxID=2268027 RepID=UPI0011EBC7A1|nr:ABC transporter ATP-binding protein [Neorhizobium sp. P12A]KAA0685036.1 ABC transporter ATP-binding protein [Neorhizobium sp. P12A]
MTEDVVVAVKGLNKKFSRSLKRSFASGIRSLVGWGLQENPNALSVGEFWALKNINLELKKGESLGLVGANGSGKTTLLRLIAGVIAPTSGTIDVKGKIAPMLALGAGFEPALSGSENIHLNMSLLGLSTDDIRAQYNEVVDFAELGESIHAPVGTYSTGMRMRLGFACAVFTDPQLLIVDEVLAVGDSNFRIKCRKKISEIRNNGASLILVSHSRLSVEYLTNRAIYLHKGRIKAEGDSKSVLDAYETDLAKRAAEKVSVAAVTATENIVGYADDAMTIDQIRCVDANGFEIEQVSPGEYLAIEITVSTHRTYEGCAFNVMFKPTAEPVTYHPNSSQDDFGPVTITPGAHTIRFEYKPIVYLPGLYTLKINVSQGLMMDILCHREDKSIRVLRPEGKSIRSQYIVPMRLDLGDLQVTPLAEDDMDFEEVEDL